MFQISSEEGNNLLNDSDCSHSLQYLQQLQENTEQQYLEEILKKIEAEHLAEMGQGLALHIPPEDPYLRNEYNNI